MNTREVGTMSGENTRVPRETVRLPGNVNMGRNRGASNPYMPLFENGPTPEGEGYPLPLPTDPAEYERERRNTASKLHNARERFNASRPDNADHLTHRVHSEPGVMYVVIIPKYSTDTNTNT